MRKKILSIIIIVCIAAGISYAAVHLELDTVFHQEFSDNHDIYLNTETISYDMDTEEEWEKETAIPKSEDRYFEAGDWKCYINDDNGTVTIQEYTSDGDRVKVPGTIKGRQVTDIGDYAFKRCMNLKSITIPQGITSIGAYAFYGCSSLATVKLPKGIKSIGEYGFYGCGDLKQMELPEGLESIGEYAFSACYSLYLIYLPESLKNIENNAFCYSHNLPLAAKYPGDKTSWDQVFVGEGNEDLLDVLQFVENKEKYEYRILKDKDHTIEIIGCHAEDATTLTVPEQIDGRTVTKIGGEAFSDCRSLKSIELPKGLKSIGDRAFAHCYSLESIEIPEGVEEIGKYAFCECRSLSSIRLPENLMKIERDVFNGCGSLKDVYYPKDRGTWNFLFVGSGNEVLKSADIHFKGEWCKTF